jgi:hypothetical protein
LKSKEAIDEIFVWFPSTWAMGAEVPRLGRFCVQPNENEPDGECALQERRAGAWSRWMREESSGRRELFKKLTP